jgi:hypothetical protein
VSELSTKVLIKGVQEALKRLPEKKDVVKAGKKVAEQLPDRKQFVKAGKKAAKIVEERSFSTSKLNAATTKSIVGGVILIGVIVGLVIWTTHNSRDEEGIWDEQDIPVDEVPKEEI